MFGSGNKLQVIVYDEDEMKSFGGYLDGISIERGEELDVTPLEDTAGRTIIHGPTMDATMRVFLFDEIIKLDPTTMKRIAKFNLEKENEELLKEIGRNKKNIEQVKSNYEDMKKRLQTISEISSDIWENGSEYKKEYDDFEF